MKKVYHASQCENSYASVKSLKLISDQGGSEMVGKIFTALSILGWILLAIIIVDCIFFNSKLIIGVLGK